MKTIETERLILRGFKQSDVIDFFEYAKSDKVGPMAGWKTHDSIEESKKILNLFIEKKEVWGIEDKISHKLIGSIGLHKDSKRDNPKSLMLGYVLSEDYWGKGLMLEASRAVLNYGFNDLNMDIITVYHYPFNKQSESVIKNLGFKYEGLLRQATLRYDGVILDNMCYSLTRDEFNAL